MSDRSFYGLIFAVMLACTVAIGQVSAATLTQVRSFQQTREQQLHRDRGTVRFMLRRPWSRSRPGFMRAERQAERRIVAELGSLRRLRALEQSILRPAVDVAAWQPTVDCENSGSWADSPGYYLYGLQFDPATWRVAAEHTGRWDASPASQVINAVWTAETARRTGLPDPWPHCPDPYFG